MKTGIELIAIERQEQIEKHGWSLQHDQKYVNGELIEAAEFCINPEKNKWPAGWDVSFKDKIITKTEIERLTVAGAFYKAENDRVGIGLFDNEINDIAFIIDSLLNQP